MIRKEKELKIRDDICVGCSTPPDKTKQKKFVRHGTAERTEKLHTYNICWAVKVPSLAAGVLYFLMGI